MIFIFYFFILISFQTQASLSPLRINDILPKNKPGLFFGNENFSIHSGQTKWLQVDSSLIKPKKVKVEYRSPDKKSPTRLTLRTDKTKKKYSILQYLKKSIHDYRRFGMKIIKSRSVQINSNRAHILDLKQEAYDLYNRQIFFKKDEVVIILTCTGRKSKFQIDIKSCNQIAKNFEWLTEKKSPKEIQL